MGARKTENASMGSLQSGMNDEGDAKVRWAPQGKGASVSLTSSLSLSPGARPWLVAPAPVGGQGGRGEQTRQKRRGCPVAQRACADQERDGYDWFQEPWSRPPR